MTTKTPITSSFFSKLSLLAALLLISLALVGAGAYLLKKSNDVRLTERTERLLAQATDLVQNRFTRYELGILGARGAILVAGPQQITRPRFERYINSRNARIEFPGALGFGFIRRVPKAQEQAFIESARADNAPNFSVRTLTPHQEDRFIIQYIYPQESNKTAIGLDIGSELNRRTAAINSALRDKAILTAPITLVQAESKPRYGFLILLPVYDPLLSKITPNERLEATIGWSYAALTVDQVLLNLGPIFNEISLSITDKADTQAFFESNQKQVNRNHTGISTYTDIEIMGRQWKVSAESTTQMVSALGLWSPIVLFIILSLIVFVIFGAVTLLLFKKSREVNQLVSEQEINFQTYISSLTFKTVTLSFTFLMLVSCLLYAYAFSRQTFDSAASTIEQNAERSAQLINNYHQTFRQDLHFLKSTPPINQMLGLSEAVQAGTLDTKALDQSLADIFSSYMLASPKVYQLRLISAESNGKELVRVERIDNLLRTASPDDLQTKSDRAYFKKGLELQKDEVFISDIDPNIENGVLEIPLRPTVRYVSNIERADGSIFALLVMNVDAQALLDEIIETISADQHIYVTNAQSEFLASHDTSRTFGSWLGAPFTWDDAFVAKTQGFLSKSGVNSWQGDIGSFWSKSVSIFPNENVPLGQTTVHATYLKSAVYDSIFSKVFLFVLFMLLITVIGSALFYYIWANRQRSFYALQVHQESIQREAKDRLFQNLIELSPEAMVFTDMKGIIVLINSQAEQLFKYARSEMLNKNVNILVPLNLAHQHDQHIRNFLDKPDNRPMGSGRDLLGRRKDGTTFPLEINLRAIKLDDDQTWVAASIHDISVRQETERKLRHALADAKRATEAKSAFLANMSHEIRTPLNAVIGLSHLLKDEDLAPQQLSLVNKIQLSGRSLLGIVNDILDLAKVEANEMSVNATPCELRELLTNLHSMFVEQSQSKGLQLELNLDPNLPTWVAVDSGLLRQILTNLLGNAVKFTAYGEVSLSAHCIESGTLAASQRLIYFAVKDSGIGISDEVKHKIFEPFNQADDSTTRRFGGTGLGLSIVSSLSALLGGEVGVESEVGVGSEFWLKLALPLADIDDDVYADPASNSLRIWIVGSDSYTKSRLQHTSEALGWKVLSFNSATEMIENVERNLDKHVNLPDALIIDWEMPDFDALSTLELMVNKLGHRGIPAVLVVQPDAVEQMDREERSELVDSILIDTFDASELFNAVNSAVASHTGNNNRVIEATKVEAIKALWLPNVSLLVVDDSEINLEVVGSILSRNGASVISANSGAKALEYLTQDAERFDAVLMDVQMPEMDGLETVRRIRRDLKITKLPIIALTAGTMEEDKRNAIAAGMDGFLVKPIEPTRLIHTLRNMVENYRGQGIMIQSIQSDTSTESKTDIPIIDGLKNSDELFQGDRTLFMFTLENLLKEHANLEELAAESPSLSNESERLVLANQIHKLRGSAGMLGATELYDFASEAEIRLREGEYAILPLLAKMAKSLTTLRENSASVLASEAEAQAGSDSAVSANTSKLNQNELKALIEKLEDSDLSASEVFDQSAANIKVLTGIKEFEALQALIQQLEYEKAAKLLQQYII